MATSFPGIHVANYVYLKYTIIPNNPCADAHGTLLNQQPMYDVLLHSELLLQNVDDYEVRKVARRAIGDDGRTQGTYNPDPFLNTMIYEVELPDGSIKEVNANVIAENILTQVALY